MLVRRQPICRPIKLLSRHHPVTLNYNNTETNVMTCRTTPTCLRKNQST